MYLYIVAVFLLIVLFTSALGFTLDYIQYTRELPKLLTSFRSELIADYLSAVYTRDKGWEGLDEELGQMISLNYLGDQQSAHIRLVVHDLEGKMLLNSFETLTSVGDAPLLQGERSEIKDLDSSQTVGTVTLYIAAEYIDEESRTYLVSLLTTLLIREAVTAVIAILLLVFLSRLITKPLSELQDAISSVASGQKKEITPSGSSETASLGESFNTMTRELEKQKELRKQMIADLAHDLNGPLHAIRLEARALRDGISTVDEASSEIIDDIDSISTLVYDLDYIADVDSGEIILQKKPTELKRFLLGIERHWLSYAKEGGFSLSSILPETGTQEILIDEVRMGRAVGNLIQNAVRYNRRGTSIVLKGSLENDSCLIQVCDDGKPIPSDLHEKIFERFYRGDTSRSRTTPGSGLGLSIVSRIAQLHGGSVSLESGEGKGNCFTIAFPAAQKTEA